MRRHDHADGVVEQRRSDHDLAQGLAQGQMRVESSRRSTPVCAFSMVRETISASSSREGNGTLNLNMKRSSWASGSG
jgi:hypothetical protein